MQVSDIGADAVFEDPDQRSIRVGVTVYNVSISSLEEFGGLEDVGQVLLSAGKQIGALVFLFIFVAFLFSCRVTTAGRSR